MTVLRHAGGEMPPPSPRPVEAASVRAAVNGVAIPREAVAAEVQNHPAQSPAEAEAEALRALVIRELLRQEADRLGIAAVPADLGDGRRESEEEARIRALLEREVIIPEADAATCRRYYERHRDRFRTPDLFEAAHILVAADAADEEAYGRALALAQTLIVELGRAPHRFAALARAHSDCSSARDGGRLGQVARGETTPEFEAALLALVPGELCPAPVPTRYGVHVLRLDRRVDGRERAFEEVCDAIAHRLQEASFRRAAAQYIAILVGRAEIAGFELGGGDGPLVQ